MKMVISQLEGILIELKDVAKELREVSFFSNIVILCVFHGAGGWMGVHLRVTGERKGDWNRGRVLVPAGSASPLGYI